MLVAQVSPRILTMVVQMAEDDESRYRIQCPWRDQWTSELATGTQTSQKKQQQWPNLSHVAASFVSCWVGISGLADTEDA